MMFVFMAAIMDICFMAKGGKQKLVSGEENFQS